MPTFGRREFVLAASAAASQLLLAGPAAAGGGAKIPILTYHRFTVDTPGPTTVTSTVLEEQIAALRQGRTISRLHEVVAALSSGAGPPRRMAAITIDDGHRSVFELLFPVIVCLGLPVTLFIYPSAISNADYALTWAQLREMRASGLVDIQSHTWWHPNFRTERKRLTPTKFATFVDQQLRQSKAMLEDKLGAPVDLLAWPFGIVDDALAQAARDAGYAAAFGYGGGAAVPGTPLFSIPRIPIGGGDRGPRFLARLGAIKAMPR
jgi:peptidoglycan/xylan/chitin deacetylase (PgdA/CDA1 family)